MNHRPWVSARFYRGSDGYSRCELTDGNGEVHPKQPEALTDREIDLTAIPWCERNGVEVVDERMHSVEARHRLENEAALYKLENRP